MCILHHQDLAVKKSHSFTSKPIIKELVAIQVSTLVRPYQCEEANRFHIFAFRLRKNKKAPTEVEALLSLGGSLTLITIISRGSADYGSFHVFYHGE